MKNRSGLVNISLIIGLCIFILGILNGISVYIGQKPIVYFEKITYDGNTRYSGMFYYIHYCKSKSKPQVTRKRFLYDYICSKDDSNEVYQRYKDNGRETFKVVGKLKDGRNIYFTNHIEYKDGNLFDAIIRDEISVEEVISKMKFNKYIDEDESRLYKHEKDNNSIINKEFYVAVCNTKDSNGIMFAFNEKTLDDICKYRYNDILNIRLNIDENSLTNSFVKVIIKDNSYRKNVYYNSYTIEKLDGGNWNSIYTYSPSSNLEELYLNENKEIEYNINFEKEYEKLLPGTYRFRTITFEKGEGKMHYLTIKFDL